ncbi:hypothetical protein OUZ56_032398 [Daphnia magna]|uniref:Uncharacterized protein n=1 Tax=Daphnia magna TaxID=35525 RepID=A0ABR0B8R8_9CRUS|nr:hypothetical protein OUZ56_032398 [Daphnia magna]
MSLDPLETDPDILAFRKAQADGRRRALVRGSLFGLVFFVSGALAVGTMVLLAAADEKSRKERLAAYEAGETVLVGRNDRIDQTAPSPVFPLVAGGLVGLGDVSANGCLCSYDAIISVKGTLEADLDANEKAAVHKKVSGCMAGELQEIYMKSCAKPGEEAMAPFCKCTYPTVAARMADGGEVDASLRSSLYLSCGTLYPELRAKTDFVETCVKEGSKEETCTCAFKALKAKTKLSNGVISIYADDAKKDIQASIATCAKKPASK